MNSLHLSKLIDMPKQGIYVIEETVDAKKVVYVSIVTNAIAWISRNAIDISNNCHKYKFTKNAKILCYFTDTNIQLVRNRYKSICEDYIKKEHIVYANKQYTKYAKRYAIENNKAVLSIVNSRGRVMYRLEFEKMYMAKRYAKNKSIETLIREMSVKND